MKSAGLLGAVLAGGESRRFGRDKARESVGGTSLVDRAGATLAEVCAEVVVVSSREPVTVRWHHIRDLRAERGPLAGIEAALRHAESLGLEGAFVLACDLPLVDAPTLLGVIEACGDAPACAPLREAPPGIEPLCALYRVSCLPAVTDHLDRGDLAVHRAFLAAGGVTTRVPAGDFLNLNRPHEVPRAEAALRARDVPTG